jgi:hypothetical protein
MNQSDRVPIEEKSDVDVCKPKLISVDYEVPLNNLDSPHREKIHTSMRERSHVFQFTTRA